MKCQYHDLVDMSKEACDNVPYASITVSGSEGSMTLDVCEEHLSELALILPVTESDEAYSQRTA